MTMAVNIFRCILDRFCDQCIRFFPCLANPARRSSLCVKVVLLIVHLTYVGFLFIIDKNLIRNTLRHPWYHSFRILLYTALYLVFFVATLVQFLLTSGSSPGYVVDAMRALNEREALLRAASVDSTEIRASSLHNAETSLDTLNLNDFKICLIDQGTLHTNCLCITYIVLIMLVTVLIKQRQPSTSKNRGSLIDVDEDQFGRYLLEGNTSWKKLVMDMYPHGSSFRQWTCTYCSVLQPPRAKHCHECDKCVLQFDHHCGWLGTCIGQNNHCRFWWFICEEAALCLWTGFLYVGYLKADISRSWWMDAVMLLLLIFLTISLIFLALLLLFHSYLALTNQTTYELVRRRRIAYMRVIPNGVYPFSEGICRNLYNFCFVQNSTYRLERLPTPQELEDKNRPYTLFDILSCRCC
ncbi:hypothetical protein V2J09_021487 [Rumex salicifolius]